MKARSSLVLVALAALLAPAVGAQDVGLEDRWTIAVQGGLVSEVSGNVLTHTEGSLFERQVTVFSNSYRKIYETGFSDLYAGVTIGFGVTPNGEIFARGTRFNKTPVGFFAGTVEGSDLVAILEPYDEWGVELGYRFYLAWRTRMKSYIAPVAGIRFTDRILITQMSAPDRGSFILNVPLYQASNVPVFGADVGFTIDLGSHFYLGLEAELRYQTKLSPAETFPGLSGMNDGGNRWSAPVFLTVGVRF
jgi:hypothetical protein